MLVNFLHSPLEQFQIVPIFSIYSKLFDISITNQTIIAILIIFFAISYFFLVKTKNNSLYLVPNKYQVIIENIYNLILSLVNDNIKSVEGKKFFPLLFCIFFFILVTNLIGLIPYSFTLTSHIAVTFFLSFSIFLGINIICYKKHKTKMLSLFLPPGTSLGLAFLLVPIELISYIFKPISLSIRLFANMMAGHTLLKVIAGFGAVLITSSGIFFLLHYLPIMILIPLFVLELGVAVIQSFVFAILICIYLNDAINLH